MERLYKFSGSLIDFPKGYEPGEVYVLAETPKQAIDRFFSLSPMTTISNSDKYPARAYGEFKLESITFDDAPKGLLDEMIGRQSKKTVYSFSQKILF